MLAAIALYFLSIFSMGVSRPTVYFIRHAEKPSDGSDGLSAQGVDRSHCLPTVFGSESPYNIGYIMAQKPKSNGKRARPYETVVPLAEKLGLEIDTSCDRDDNVCVVEAVNDYIKGGGTQNILICWEHKRLTDLVKALSDGDENAPKYPGDRFDLIWTDSYDYSDGVVDERSQCCPGLDDC